MGVCSRFEDDGSPLVAPPPPAYAPAVGCDSTSSAPGPAGSTSTLSSAFGRRWTGRGEGISRPLLGWRQEVVSGCRRRPARKPIQSHRPVNPAKLLHDVQIQFAIEILRRVGVPPTGSPVSVSGCLIVSEALGRLGPSEETVKRIWREYKGPFALVMRKYWKATAERAGLSKYHTKA